MQLFLDLPFGLRAALGALVVVQLSLQVWGLIDLNGRAVVPGGRKWPWALVIIAGSVLGAVVYLAVGRSATADADMDHDFGADRTEQRTKAVDRLYGDRDA